MLLENSLKKGIIPPRELARPGCVGFPSGRLFELLQVR